MTMIAIKRTIWTAYLAKCAIFIAALAIISPSILVGADTFLKVKKGDTYYLVENVLSGSSETYNSVSVLDGVLTSSKSIFEEVFVSGGYLDFSDNEAGSFEVCIKNANIDFLDSIFGSNNTIEKFTMLNGTEIHAVTLTGNSVEINKTQTSNAMSIGEGFADIREMFFVNTGKIDTVTISGGVFVNSGYNLDDSIKNFHGYVNNSETKTVTLNGGYLLSEENNYDLITFIGEGKLGGTSFQGAKEFSEFSNNTIGEFRTDIAGVERFLANTSGTGNAIGTLIVENKSGVNIDAKVTLNEQSISVGAGESAASIAAGGFVAKIDSARIKNAGTMNEVKVTGGTFENETTGIVTGAEVTDGGLFENFGTVTTLNLNGGTISGTGEIDTLNFSGGTFGEIGAAFSDNAIGTFTAAVAGVKSFQTDNNVGGNNTIESIVVQNSENVTETVMLTDRSVSVGNAAIGTGGLFSEITNTVFENSGTVANTIVTGGTFKNDGTVAILNLNGGKLTGTDSTATVGSLAVGNRGVFDTTAYQGEVETLAFASGGILYTKVNYAAGGDNTYSTANVTAAANLNDAAVLVNIGELIAVEAAIPSFNGDNLYLYSNFKKDFDIKEIFTNGEKVTGTYSSLRLDADGKDLSAGDGTFAGFIEGIGKLTVTGTLTLEDLANTQIAAQELVLGEDAQVRVAVGTKGTFTDLIVVSKEDNDKTDGVKALISQNKKTVLTEFSWKAVTIADETHLALTVNSLTVSEYLTAQGNTQNNTELIGSLIDNLARRTASITPVTPLARIMPMTMTLAGSKSNEPDWRDKLESLNVGGLNEVIHNALAGELAGNAMRSAMWSPYRSLFRYLDDSSISRISVSNTQSPILGQSPKKYAFDVWFTPYAQSEKGEADSYTYTGYDMTRWGVMLGGNVNINNYTLIGAYFGYADPAVKSDLGKITANDYSFGLYAQIPIIWNINTNLMFGYGNQDYTYTSGAAKTDFGGSALYGSLELSKNYTVGKFRLVPLLALDFQKASMDEFTITNGIMSNRVTPDDLTSASLRFGVLGSFDRFRARLQYSRQLDGNDFVTSGTAITSPGGAASGSVRSVQWGKDNLNFGLGGYVFFDRHFRVLGNYDLDVSKQTASHTGSVNMTLMW